MAEKNFMTARTEIEGCLEKRNALISKTSAIVAEVCIGRANAGKITASLDRDLDNLLDGFSESDKAEIMKKVTTHLLKNGKFKNSKPSNEDDDDDYNPSNIFSKRGFR